MRLILIAAVLFLVAQSAAPFLRGFTAGIDYDPARQGEVVLLSTATCPYCARMRAYLRAGGVPYRELDVERDPEGRARFAAAGGFGVPVLLVGDEVAVQGYDPAAVREALSGR
jgi:glutaredoxin